MWKNNLEFVVKHRLDYDWQGNPTEEYYPADDDNDIQFYFKSRGYEGVNARELMKALNIGFMIADRGYTGIKIEEEELDT